MTAPVFYATRKQIGLRDADYVNPWNWARVTHIVVHWPGSKGTIGTDLEKIKGYIRGWQDFHMGPRGWSDIAYNVGVDQAGRLFELRGWGRRDGATSGYGGRSFSILAILGTDETPTEDMKATIRRVMDYADSRAVTGTTVRTYHGSLVQTDCPGRKLTEWVKGGLKVIDRTPPKPAPPIPPKPEPLPTQPAFPLPSGSYFGPRYPLSNAKSVSGYYSHRVDLQKVEAKLQKLATGTSTAPDLVADGLYGADTRAAVQAFQKANRLSVDGLIGPITWIAIFAAKTTSTTI